MMQWPPSKTGLCLHSLHNSAVTCPGLPVRPSASRRISCPPAAGAVPRPSARKPLQTTSSSAASTPSTATSHDPAAQIAVSLRQLQHSACSLDAEPTVDGLLTAFQQLSHIQNQLQQECRQCKVVLYRVRRDARARKAAAAAKAALPGRKTAERKTAPAEDGFAAAVEAAQAQLSALNHLRASTDDAQDYLLSLVQQLLQDQPPAACSQLLTSCAFRQLNVEALNRLAVNAFVDKQDDASPQDMARLMAALSLVRCCSSSSSNQVAGFERSQLSSLFSSIMSHLLAHISHALLQEEQQEQQQTSAASTRRRRPAKAAGGGAADVGGASGQAAAAAAAAEDDEDDVSLSASLQQQVAAALAAHVSARIPVNSTLAPHVLHMLQGEAPRWLHTLADVELAPSISHLAQLLSHPSRYDYPYLAAALNRLSELTDQQQQQQQQQQGSEEQAEAGAATAMQQQRLTKVLVGRLRQLQADATVAELPVVLTAASKLGVQDRRFFAAVTAKAISQENLAHATDAYLATVMYVTATFDSSTSTSSKADTPDFSRQQQHRVLKKCLEQLVRLVQQQYLQQQQQQQPRSIAAAAAAALAGSCSSMDVDAAGNGGAAAGRAVEAPNVLMALWAAASSGVALPKQLRLAPVFNYLCSPAVVQQLTGSATSRDSRGQHKTRQQQQQDEEGAEGPAQEEVARSCGTVLWAAAQLGYSGPLDRLKPYMASFLDSTRAIPVPCSSILTVVVSLANLLHRHQHMQQQHQQSDQAYTAGYEGLAFWQSAFLQCSQEVVARLQQQQQDQEHLLGPDSCESSSALDGSAVSVAAAMPAGALQGSAVAVVVAQLLWAYQTVGLHLSGEELAVLLQLTQGQEPPALTQLVLQRGLACSVEELLQQLQSRAAGAALADLSTAAAALNRLLDLQQHQQQQQQQQGGSQGIPASFKTGVRQCCSIVAQHLVPAMQQQQQQQQPPSAADTSAAPAAAAGQQDAQEEEAAAAATVAAASAVIWALSQLQYRDASLSSSCLQAISSNLQALRVQDAAAVVAAMSEAGRAVSSIYSSRSSSSSDAPLQEVVAACTDKLLQHLLPEVYVVVSPAHAPTAAAAADRVNQQENSTQQEAAGDEQQELLLAGSSSAVLAQKLLQLHAALGLQPAGEQALQLLSLVSDESCLCQLKDNAAAAVIVASLSAVAELSVLPGWQGFGRGDSSSSSMSGSRGSSRGDRKRSDGRAASQHNNQQLRFPWAWQDQQQQLLQEVWQRLLLEGLLPRLTRATPKQVSTALEAVVQLAGQDGGRQQQQQQQQQHAGPFATAAPPAVLDIGLAKDFARAVLDMLAPEPLFSATAAAEDGSTADSTQQEAHSAAMLHPLQQRQDGGGAAAGHGELDMRHQWHQGSPVMGSHDGLASSSTATMQDDSGFLAEWKAGEWKGEHLTSVAAAVVALDISRPGFFSAVEADLLPAGLQQQQQQRKSRVTNVQLQHMIIICSAAAAVDCRVEQLLQHTVQQTLSQVQQQQATTQAAPAASRPGGTPAGAKQQRMPRKSSLNKPLEPELVLLLGWAVAVMDVPQLAEQATQLAAAGVDALQSEATTDLTQLPEVVAARLMQLHLWLQTAAGQPSTSSVPAGLSTVLGPAGLQSASNAWVSLQQSSNACLESVAAALRQLVQLSQPQSLGCNVVTADGVTCADVYVVLQGLPVAHLLLDDGEAPGNTSAVAAAGSSSSSSVAAAAAERLAAYWMPAAAAPAPAAASQGNSSTPRPAAGQSARQQRLLLALSKQRLGDVLFRTKALVTLGCWVEVISSRDWMLLEGHMDAQVAFLQDRLWPLLAQPPEIAGADDANSVVLGAERMALPA